MEPADEIQTVWVIEITGLSLKKEQWQRESYFLNPFMPTWIETSTLSWFFLFFFSSLALRLGTRMPAHHCHLCRRDDTTPNCFSREINSALRPALLDPCHHGLITDFDLTPTSLCSSMENCIRCNPINAPSQYPPPPTSPPQSHGQVLTRTPKVTWRG